MKLFLCFDSSLLFYRDQKEKSRCHVETISEKTIFMGSKSLFADYESALSSARTFRLFPAGDETFDRMRDGIIL